MNNINTNVLATNKNPDIASTSNGYPASSLDFNSKKVSKGSEKAYLTTVTDTPPSYQQAVRDEALAAVNTLLDIQQFEYLQKNNITNFINQLIKVMPEIALAKDEIINFQIAILAKHNYKNKIANLYIQYFTLADLNKLNEIFKQPVAIKHINFNIKLQNEFANLMQNIVANKLPELKEILDKSPMCFDSGIFESFQDSLNKLLSSPPARQFPIINDEYNIIDKILKSLNLENLILRFTNTISDTIFKANPTLDRQDEFKNLIISFVKRCLQDPKINEFMISQYQSNFSLAELTQLLEIFNLPSYQIYINSEYSIIDEGIKISTEIQQKELPTLKKIIQESLNEIASTEESASTRKNKGIIRRFKNRMCNIL